MKGLMGRWPLIGVLVCGMAGGLTCGSGGDQPSNAADFEARFSAAFCDRFDRCCRMKGTSVDESLCGPIAGASVGLFAPGQRGFDGKAAADCLAAVRRWDCAETGLTPDLERLCSLAYAGAGTAANGAACTFDVDCAQPVGGRAICVRSTCRVQALPGQTGAACLDPPILSCAFDQGLTCLIPIGSVDAGTCGPRRAAGQTCRVSTDCVNGADCTGNVCQSPIPAGQPCSTPNCEWGTSCNPATGICTPDSLIGRYYCKTA